MPASPPHAPTEKADFRNLEAAEASGEEIDFSFGRNWRKYLDKLDTERLDQARASLRTSLDGLDLGERTFIDAGCGSGVFSLSALELGAREVLSVDIDPNSIACARTLRARSQHAERWHVVQGSLMSPAFVSSLPPADVVYCWGVLHHTGAMWEAIDNVTSLVRPGGTLLLALYRAPTHIRLHMALKRLYNRTPPFTRPALQAAYAGALVAHQAVTRRVTPWSYVRDYGRRSRGMSLWRDAEDWLGGLPCEFATGDDVRRFLEPRGFRLIRSLEGDPGANGEHLLRREA